VTRRPSDTRDRILAAALELFAERGFHGTAVPDIARTAGVGAGSLYRHFEGKEALVNEVFRQCKRELLARVFAEGWPEGAPFRVRFHLMWSRWMGFARDNPVAMAFLELHHHQPYLDDDSRALEDTIERMVAEHVSEAQASQVLADVPADVLVALVHGSLIGLVRASRHGRVTLTDALVAETEERVWAAVRR
jgi:AcrR family transcriptional regulator